MDLINNVTHLRNLTQERINMIMRQNPIVRNYRIENADLLHPKKQSVIVQKITPISPDTKCITLGSENGKALAYFQAGQYISISYKDTTRPYSLVSSPKQSEKGIYRIAVKNVPGGIVSNYLLNKLKAGDTLEISAPMGDFCHSGIRDSRRVIAIAGGSGITPFISMCQSILEGTEDFDLTVVYGCNTEKDILFHNNLMRWVSSSDKITVLPVVGKFIDAALLSEVIQEGDTVYVCGPSKMISHIQKELSKLTSSPKNIRYEIMGAYQNRHLEENYQLTVLCHGQSYNTSCSSDAPLIQAIEALHLVLPTACRSGVCGLCHSKLLEGQVYVADIQDGRRNADKIYDYIHPCVSYPDSDIVIEIP